MENLLLEFNGTRDINKESIAGIAKKKDVEIKIKKANESKSKVTINSDINTDKNLWEALLDRFFLVSEIHADIEINDFGAKPSTISFRLNEALEIALH